MLRVVTELFGRHRVAKEEAQVLKHIITRVAKRTGSTFRHFGLELVEFCVGCLVAARATARIARQCCVQLSCGSFAIFTKLNILNFTTFGPTLSFCLGF